MEEEDLKLEALQARLAKREQQIERGEESPFKGTAKQVIAELKTKLEAQAT